MIEPTSQKESWKPYDPNLGSSFPCPNCGNSMSMMTARIGDDAVYRPGCSNADCKHYNGIGTFWDYDSAFRAWNKHAAPPDHPIIVCFCGSGRFREAHAAAEYNETLNGKIVLTIGCNTHDIERSATMNRYKAMLDELHLRKIDLADEILVINVDGYIGESTRQEIVYATQLGKPVRLLEPEIMPGCKTALDELLSQVKPQKPD